MQAEGPTTDEWRQTNVEQFIRVFQALRADRRRIQVAEIVGFAPDVDRETLGAHLDQFIKRYLVADTFDVQAISMIVAQFDALRTEARPHADDAAALTELRDLLLPLCLHPGIKAEVARKMEQHGGAIIREAVALAVGAELVAAQADCRSVTTVMRTVSTQSPGTSSTVDNRPTTWAKSSRTRGDRTTCWVHPSRLPAG